MAKDLPYFKFFCSEWNDGDITLEDYKTQGLFINICSYYWSKECNLSFDKLIKRFKRCEEEIGVLLGESIIKRDEDDNIRISFLDEQQEERDATSNRNSLAGKKSAEKRKLAKLEQESNTNSTSVEIPLNVNPTIKRREEKKREEEKRKEGVFNSWWELYDNKKGLSKSKAKFLKLSDEDIKAILKITPVYVSSTPDVKYRKLPLTWLNGEHWNDDLTPKKKKFINPCF